MSDYSTLHLTKYRVSHDKLSFQEQQYRHPAGKGAGALCPQPLLLPGHVVLATPNAADAPPDDAAPSTATPTPATAAAASSSGSSGGNSKLPLQGDNSYGPTCLLFTSFTDVSL